jgi:uracil-DNA glycosylase
MDRSPALRAHQSKLALCRRCPRMQSTPVIGSPAVSRILLVGQAPGSREAALHRPFAWTAGKTLFKWFREAGLEEDAFRARIYMAAVCRCFPGRNPAGGDRVPAPDEVLNCASWLDAELLLLKPRLVIAAGRLAIEQFMPIGRLEGAVGAVHRVQRATVTFDLLPLPHPSGASTWIHVQPGKTLLRRALMLLAQHAEWRRVCAGAAPPRKTRDRGQGSSR